MNIGHISAAAVSCHRPPSFIRSRPLYALAMSQIDDAVFQVTSLISTYSPPFIYIYDPFTPRTTASTLQGALSESQIAPSVSKSNIKLRCAFVDPITCFTPRLFYDTVLNALAEWVPDWDEGCSNWTGPRGADGERFNESLDAFLHGLHAVKRSLLLDARDGQLNGKGKRRDVEHWPNSQDYRLVIVIERAERLKESMPDLMVPLTRLAELVRAFVPSHQLGSNP